MDHIPAEVLHLMFIQLDLDDRLECMLVCRSWYSILDLQSLLYDIRIRYHQYSKFKNMVTLRPYRAMQVEYLALNIHFGSNFDTRGLCNTFPNLRQLEIKDYYDGTVIGGDIDENFHFTYPMSKLESIADSGECELTRQLVMSNMCHRLKSLELDLQISPHVITKLKNMPVLTSLRLIGPSVKLTDLEILHKNVPSIKTLKFEDLGLLPSDILDDVIPQPTITELELVIRHVENQSAHVQFYKYMSNKYPSINRLSYFDYETRGRDFDYIRQVYNDGIFPFHQTIGSQVDYFHFENYCDGLDAFRKFDEFGMKLNQLSIKSIDDGNRFLEELAQSDQSKYIEKLTLREILPEPVSLLKNMQALEDIIIICSDSYSSPEERTKKVINFNQLIDACPPTLTTLFMDCVYLTFDATTSTLTTIRYLYINQVDLTLAFAKAIEVNFPNLLSLRIRGTIAGNLTITMPEHGLETVEITTLHKKGDRNGFSIRTTCNQNTQYYTRAETNRRTTHERSQAIGNVMPVPEKLPGDPFMVSLVCCSVKKLSLSTFQKFENAYA